jgi:hypothetical protein
MTREEAPELYAALAAHANVSNDFGFGQQIAANARKTLIDEIKKQMVREAEAAGIDSINATVAGIECKQNGEEVETPKSLLLLDEMYCDNIEEFGFFSRWSEESGWSKEISVSDKLH